MIKDFSDDYVDFLKDESRLNGRADSISFPGSEKEIIEDLKNSENFKKGITIQGARTGVTGGAVPSGGHILNLSRLNKIVSARHDFPNDHFFITVHPGTLLSDIQHVFEINKGIAELAQGRKYFFPPDVTERSATIGGMAANNASGAESFFYGPTRNFIEKIKIILSNGETLTVKRGGAEVKEGKFSVVTDSGTILEGHLPLIKKVNVKNAAGYYVRKNMDLMDLFIGSEGTLGIFSEIEIRLIIQPRIKWSVMSFFPSEDMALKFVEKIRKSPNIPKAIEFFGHNALGISRKNRKSISGFSEMPDIPISGHTGIYMVYDGIDEEAIEQEVLMMSEVMDECGGNSDDVWVACNDKESEKIKKFRHAIPETINMFIDKVRKDIPEITKLSTDMSVPDHELIKVMEMYRTGAEKSNIENVIFGHIGDNHFHVNLIPKNMKEYEKGKELIVEWAKTVVKMGGTVSAEHGIGKLKRSLFREMFNNEDIEKMRTIKSIFDPENILNPGNLFEQ